MNRRASLSAASATALVPIVPALAAPLPVEPGNRDSLILTVTGRNSVRLDAMGNSTVVESQTFVVYVDGVVEKTSDPVVSRKVYERLHRQMREDGYPATNCPYIPADFLGL